MATFFTSDHHFGDGRRLGIDRRPFASRDEMDCALVARWNAVVGEDDEVWHLGDFARTPEIAATCLARLRGRKHLVPGNNDPPEVLALPGWASVAPYVEMEADGIGLVLCHYPFRTWNGMGRGWLDLHGHSHGRLKPMPRQYDVGVDVFGFRPVRLAEIRGTRRPHAQGRLSRGR